MSCCLSPLVRRYISNQILVDDTCEDAFSIAVQGEGVIPGNRGDIFVIAKYEKPGSAYEITGCCKPGPTCHLNRYAVEGKLRKFGCKYCICEDVVVTDVDDAVLNMHAEAAAIQYHEKKRDVLIEHIDATVASINAIHGTNQKTPTDFSRPDHLDILSLLAKNCAPTFFNCIDASGNVGTTPLPPSYLVITHTDIYKDIKKAFGCDWWGVERYINCNGCSIPFEWGAAERARFIFTPYAPTTTNASGDTVYKMIYIGGGAFWSLRQENYPPEVMLKGREFSDMGDCYQLIWKALIGYITAFENRVITLNVTRGA